jgi:hypothetical protein
MPFRPQKKQRARVCESQGLLPVTFQKVVVDRPLGLLLAEGHALLARDRSRLLRIAVDVEGQGVEASDGDVKIAFIVDRITGGVGEELARLSG